MAIPAGLTLAMDAQFRELSNFITPPRAGKITAIESNGQLRVATDDPDGGDVLAWPLDGLRYAVDDVVYITFAVNNPESAIVLGSKGSAPAQHELTELSVVRDLAAAATDAPVAAIHQANSGDDQPALQVTQEGSGALLLLKDGGTTVLRVHDGGRLDVYNLIRALTSSGLCLEDDAGNQAILVADGGDVAIGTITDPSGLEITCPTTTATQGRTSLRLGIQSNTARIVIENGPAGEAWGIDVHTSGVFRWFRAGVVALALTPGGGMGIGLQAPQGTLHAYRVGGGFLHETKANVGATPVVIIPNGTGDVTRAAHVTFVLSDGSSAVANTFTLVQGGTMSVPISLGSSTWTVTLNANGQVSVARTAGSATATINFVITWI